MNNDDMLQIREFSIISGISRRNLRFYDMEGLLKPEIRGENGYRYYTSRQINSAYLISDLRALGVGLPTIKKYASERSPEKMMELFKEQNSYIEAEIKRLRSMQELMRLRAEMTRLALKYKENTVLLEEREREPIFLCPPLNDMEDEYGLVHSYDVAAAHGINVSFPIGELITQKDIKSGDWTLPSQYYFKVRKPHNAWKPAGTYAVYYGKWVNGSPKGFYEQLLDFIEDNGLRMDGNAYGEYLLDELTTHEEDLFVIRVEVPVNAAM